MSSPLLAGLPFAVRPDMLGVALQSIGLLLVLSSLEVGAGSKVKLAFGYAAFGLGLCVKQHLVFEMAVCSGLLISNRRSARISNFTIASSFAACVAVVATVYAVEWVVTGGEIWRSAFVAASRVGRIYPGDLGNVDIFVYGLIRRDSGYLALLALLCLTPLGFAQGVFRKSALIVGAAAFSIPSLNFAAWGSWKTNTLEVTNHFVGLSACIVFLACCIRGRRLLLGNRLDAVLWTCLAGEVSLVLLMAYLSTGTWFNYAIQAAVLGSVIVARIADRVIDALPSPWAAWPITLGLLAITLASYDHIADADAERRNDRMSVEKIWETLELPRDSVFFADYPGANRIGGRLDLVYDHWLYRVFESAHLATSRSSWLHHVLQTKTLRSVVTLDEQMILEGTGIPLRNYAFRPSIRVGRFYVWVR